LSAPTYPAYVESGIPWLGMTPESWTLQRIKDSVAHAKNGVWGDEPLNNVDDIWCVRVADFDRRRLSVTSSDPTIRNVQQTDRRGRMLLRGDLLLEKSGGGEISPVGLVVLFDEDEPAVCSNFVAGIRLKADQDSRFWLYFHSHMYSSRVNQRSIKQTSGIQNLDQASYFDERVAVPPLGEQRLIAKYLDQEIGNIDELIGKQEHLIEVLSERRHSFIESRLHALTTWKRLKLAWAFEFLNGDRGVNYPSPEEITTSGVPFINAGDLSGGQLQTDHLKYVTEEKYAAMGGAKVRSGDILYCLRGSLGKNAHIIEIDNAALASSLVAIRNRNPEYASTRFVFWLLNSSSEQIQRELASSGSAQPNLSAESVGQMSFMVPRSLDNQVQIAREIDEYANKHHVLTMTATRSIELLRERRAALIRAAVTGKIDVRGL
jgi:type I restriction enzyme, S subunit